MSRALSRMMGLLRKRAKEETEQVQEEGTRQVHEERTGRVHEEETEEVREEEIRIILKAPTSRPAESRRYPSRDECIAYVLWGEEREERLPVFIEHQVLGRIIDHTEAEENLTKEVGGVLLGKHCRDGEKEFLMITAMIRGEYAREGRTRFTFTHRTWECIHRRIQEIGTGDRVVGWYHSHPGIGVFPSQDDSYVHNNFFSAPWQVALIVDPLGRVERFFRSAERRLEAYKGFFVYGRKENELDLLDLGKTIGRLKERVKYRGLSRRGGFLWYSEPVEPRQATERRQGQGSPEHDRGLAAGRQQGHVGRYAPRARPGQTRHSDAGCLLFVTIVALFIGVAQYLLLWPEPAVSIGGILNDPVFLLVLGLIVLAWVIYAVFTSGDS